MYSTKYASFFGHVVPGVHKWALSILELLNQVHEIFTQYRGIIYAVNAHIEIAISIFVSECKSYEWGEFAIIHKIGCHGNVPWDIGKRGPDQWSAPKTLSFGEKIAKIGPADPEIIVVRAIIKKEINKERN